MGVEIVHQLCDQFLCRLHGCSLFGSNVTEGDQGSHINSPCIVTYGSNYLLDASNLGYW